MAESLTFGCDCGNLRGEIRDITPARGTHAECYCLDCQSFARHLGRGDILGDRSETRIFQTSMWRAEITHGHAHLRCLRLGPKGMLRWYSGCCNTPIANTFEKGKLNFAGFLIAAMGANAQQVTGPVVGRYKSGSATGEGPALKDCGMSKIVWGLVTRALAAKLRGHGAQSPFFTTDRSPISPPVVLTREERSAARGG